MKRRKGLTAEDKTRAVQHCEGIEATLHSLLYEVLNGKAYCAGR